jgi:hypothetical protein
VGFVVDKVALGQVFSEYFGFPCLHFYLSFYDNFSLLCARPASFDIHDLIGWEENLSDIIFLNMWR